jgi:murein DD-endopeptidase MepM/ murein hydrolase activator NlpD
MYWGIYSSCDGLANIGLNNNQVAFFNSFSDKAVNSNVNTLFFSQANAIPLETPDLKIIQDNTIGGITTPSVVSGKVLGAVFGGNSQKEVIDHIVQSGDTLQSIAEFYKISVNTLLWANDLSTTSKIKVGQRLSILPVDGVLHIVKSGDTISGISQTYKVQTDNIVSYNNLANQSDVYVGDILIVPEGVMPKKSAPVINYQAPIANNFFIYPTEGYIAQGLHYYNAVDIANKCGTPIYAAAAGVVQRAVGNGLYNQGMGNHITILHSNKTVTYYGHLMTLAVKPGEKVSTGQKIGLMGGQPGMAGAGKSTGCHIHFQVTGAANWLASYALGTKISYK